MAGWTINKRGLVSFLTLFGFLIMALTGLVLYIMPAGRVAYWIHWEMIGLSKTGWGNIHILSSILFIVAGAWHIYYNWKSLMNYFKDKLRKGIKLRRELSISLVLSIWIIVGAIWPFPPTSYLLDFNSLIKEVWVEEDDYEPPFGHAELMTLRVFCKKMEIDLDKAVRELKANGIEFDNDQQTLEEIGDSNDISPMNLYLLIKKFEPGPDMEKLQTYTPESVEVEFSGTGIGNRSLQNVCENAGLETDTALARLATAGISGALDQTVKSIAESSDTQPIEIIKILLVEGYSPATRSQ